jgi:hypothetical protein
MELGRNCSFAPLNFIIAMKNWKDYIFKKIKCFGLSLKPEKVRKPQLFF